MLTVVVFALGIANFALHKAVLESGHALVRQMGWLARGKPLPFSLIVEFALLLAALAANAQGWGAAAAAYFAYSLLNGVSAWLILSGRI